MADQPSVSISDPRAIFQPGMRLGSSCKLPDAKRLKSPQGTNTAAMPEDNDASLVINALHESRCAKAIIVINSATGARAGLDKISNAATTPKPKVLNIDLACDPGIVGCVASPKLEQDKLRCADRVNRISSVVVTVSVK